jgi:hypothetical protein
MTVHGGALSSILRPAHPMAYHGNFMIAHNIIMTLITTLISYTYQALSALQGILFSPAYYLPEALPYQPLVVTHDAIQYYVTPLNVRPHMFKKYVNILAVSTQDDGPSRDMTTYFKTLAGPYLTFYGQRVTPAQVDPDATSMTIMYTLPEAPFTFLTHKITGKEMYEPMTFQYGLALGKFVPGAMKSLDYLDVAA